MDNQEIPHVNVIKYQLMLIFCSWDTIFSVAKTPSSSLFLVNNSNNKCFIFNEEEGWKWD